MAEGLALIYQIQLIDSEILDARRKLAALDDGKLIEAELNAEKQAFEEADSSHKTMVAELHASELEQKSIEEKKAKFEQRLYSGSITNPKELDNTEKEVEMLGRQRGRLDEKILKLWDDIETAKALVETTKSAFTAKQAVYDEHMSLHKTQKNTLEQQWVKLDAQRKEQAAKADPALLSRYDAVRQSHGGVGIVKVEGEICGACKMPVPAFTLNRLREHAPGLITCESCSRILYFEE